MLDFKKESFLWQEEILFVVGLFTRKEFDHDKDTKISAYISG